MSLSQRSTGTAASDLARMAAGPPTTVHASLRALAGHGLVERAGNHYRLVRDHPAAAEAVALGLRIGDPADAMRVILRANDGVAFAALDEIGVVLGEHPASPDVALLDGALATIARGRTDTPAILRFEMEELARIVHSAVALRRRIAEAEIVKGSVGPAVPLAGARSPGSPGGAARIPQGGWDH